VKREIDAGRDSQILRALDKKSFVFWDVGPRSVVRWKSASMEQAAGLSACLSTLNIEAIFFSETSVEFHRTRRRNMPEYKILHNHFSENMRSSLMMMHM
jgi:hypothetical protein